MACNAACVTAHARAVLADAEHKLKMMESAERIRARFAEEAAKKAARHTVALAAVVPTARAASRRGGKALARNALMVKSRVIKRTSPPPQTVSGKK